MDEPTAVLAPQEADQLMEFVRQFVADGHAVVFITHKMKEVMEVADRIIVMRDGRISGDLRKEDTNEAELSRLMIGRDIVAPAKVDLRVPTMSDPACCQESVSCPRKSKTSR